jgi:CheY-like chemotaxis protein
MSLNGIILLVDDNPDDVFIFKRALKTARISHRVEVVASGEEALNYLASKGRYEDQKKYPPPFLIFLDLKMPRVDGFEVLSWIRQESSLNSTCVVVLSGSDEPGDQQKVTTLGAYLYMVKPPTPEKLRHLVESAMAVPKQS